MSERVPMPQPIRAFDVAANVSDVGPSYARRFSVDVAEDALQRMVPHVVTHVAEKLGERVAYEHGGAIQSAVMSYLNDRTWCEPIVRAAIVEAVVTWVGEAMGSSKFGEYLADRAGDF